MVDELICNVLRVEILFMIFSNTSHEESYTGLIDFRQKHGKENTPCRPLMPHPNVASMYSLQNLNFKYTSLMEKENKLSLLGMGRRGRGGWA